MPLRFPSGQPTHSDQNRHGRRLDFCGLGLFALERVTLPELFGGRPRFTRLALVQEIGGILATAIGPVLAATLTAVTRQWWPLAAMIVGYSLIILLSAIAAPEVGGRDLVSLEDAA